MKIRIFNIDLWFLYKPSDWLLYQFWDGGRKACKAAYGEQFLCFAYMVLK